MNEYVNQFIHISTDKAGEVINKLMGKKNILEVGCYAGQVSMGLSEITEHLTCIDFPNKFFSPGVIEHIRHNNISNITHQIVEDIFQYTKDNHHLFDGMWIDENHSEIVSLLGWLEKNTTVSLTVVYNDHITDSIKSVDIKPSRIKTKEVKSTVGELATQAVEGKEVTVPKKRTNKQSKTAAK